MTQSLSTQRTITALWEKAFWDNTSEKRFVRYESSNGNKGRECLNEWSQCGKRRGNVGTYWHQEIMGGIKGPILKNL